MNLEILEIENHIIEAQEIKPSIFSNSWLTKKKLIELMITKLTFDKRNIETLELFIRIRK